MKIQEILVESQLQEGPILNKIGSAVGKGVGALAKGVGAVAGGVAGLGSALKKGYQAGKSTVSKAGDDDSADATTPADSGNTAAAGTEPAGGATSGSGAAGGAPAAQKKAPTSAFGKLSAAANSGEEQPASGGAPAAKPAASGAPAGAAPAAKPAAKPAAGGAPAELAPNPKADTAYAQAQKAIASLPPEQKKEIVTMLQSDPKVKAAMTAAPKVKPAAKPVAGGAGAMGAMAGQLAKGGAAEPNTMANAPVSKTNKAKPGNPNAAPTAAPVATPTAAPASNQPAPAVNPEGEKPAPKKRASPKKKAAPDQATIDADRERIMGPTSDSVIRKQPALSEGFSLFRKH